MKKDWEIKKQNLEGRTPSTCEAGVSPLQTSSLPQHALKAGWEIKKIGEVCLVAAGQGAPQGENNYSNEGTPFVKAGNLVELLEGKSETEIQQVNETVAKKYKLKKYKSGSVLFAKSGMSCMKGYVYTLKNDSYVVSHLAVLTPFDCLS